MSPVTADPSKNFQELVPLREDQSSLLEAIFSSGDSDPRWSFGPGADNAIKLERSRQVISRIWGLPTQSLFFLSDRYLAFYLAIMGSYGAENFSRIAYSPIAKKEILAIVSRLSQSASVVEGQVSLDGRVSFEEIQDSLLIHELRNGETGIAQPDLPKSPVVVDATSARPNDLILGAQWRAVVLDATSWDGPRGVYPVAINPAYPWKNPFPTLDTDFPIYGSSYGLTLLAATSLEQFEMVDQSAIAEANQVIRKIVSTAGDADIAGTDTGDRISISFLYVQSEELQRTLYEDGYLVDSGSACSSSALEPSHVLTRMGLLSQGNVRLRIRPQNLGAVEDFAITLVKTVRKMRNNN